MTSLKRQSILIILLLCTFMAGYAASLRISVRTSRGDKICVGDRFTVIVTAENVNGSVPHLNVGGATNDSFVESHQVENINGNVRSVTTYRMMCRATTQGTYTIGPITVGGVRSNIFKYTIHPGNGQSTSSNAGQSNAAQGSSSAKPTYIGKGNGNLFMRASVSKTTAYEQEALAYTVKLYTSYSAIKFVGATASPKFDGFVVEESKQTDSQLRYETYQGKVYATAVIARYIIFPQMTGNLKVTGNTYTVSVDEREYYNDQFFGQMSVSRPLKLTVSPNDLNVNVKALPSPKPADFSGGVGKFSISSSMPSTSLRTGETASIVYTVSGSGNLKYVTLPDLAMVYPKQIEVYSPQTDVKANVGASSVSGTVKFDYSLMPDEEGEYKIPDVTLVYFNPETGKYETSVAKGYTVTVGKGKASAKSHRNRAKFDDKLLPVTGDYDAANLISSWAYWLVYVIAVVLLLTATVVYSKYVKANADISTVLSRKASKMARRRLRKAAECMRRGDAASFYDEMLSALWGYISYKMKMPTSELSRDNVSEVLQGAGVMQQSISVFIELIDNCEFAKYSPSNEQMDSMNSVYENGAEVINQLEKSFKDAKHNK